MDIRQQGIIRSEPGIIEKEGIYFHTASAFAQQHLFYGLWGARYLCSAPYSVRRKHLNAFLMFYIHSGEMQFTYRDQTFTASADDIVLIDCNFPHHYYKERGAVQLVSFSRQCLTGVLRSSVEEQRCAVQQAVWLGEGLSKDHADAATRCQCRRSHIGRHSPYTFLAEYPRARGTQRFAADTGGKGLDGRAFS